MLTSAPPFFSADVLKECALIALHLIAEEGRDGENGCHAPGLVRRLESGAAQRVQCERVKANLGRKTKVCLLVALEKAMRATMRCTSSGCKGLGGRICLFLKDWELGKVALSCHMALDKLCQEMHEAWQSGDATERPAVKA